MPRPLAIFLVVTAIGAVFLAVSDAVEFLTWLHSVQLIVEAESV